MRRVEREVEHFMQSWLKLLRYKFFDWTHEYSFEWFHSEATAKMQQKRSHKLFRTPQTGPLLLGAVGMGCDGDTVRQTVASIF